MTIAAAIIAVAAANGFSAIARDDGAAAFIFIPYTNRELGDGVEMVEVASLRETYLALGY